MATGMFGALHLGMAARGGNSRGNQLDRQAATCRTARSRWDLHRSHCELDPVAALADTGKQHDIVSADMLRDQGADSFLIGILLTLHAYAMLRLNEFDKAWRLAVRAREIFEPISHYSLGYAEVLASLAERAQGDLKSASARCERMFALVRGGRRNAAWVNAANALAYVRYEENRLAEAEALCTEVLPLRSEEH